MKRVIPRRRRGFTFADLLVVVVLIPLLCVAFLACSTGRTRDPSNRVKCASNLRQIGQAILLYTNENGGAYPRTVATTMPVVIPTWGTGASAANPFKDGGPAPNDVSAALFLLLRTQDITAEVFLCPSASAEKWDFGGGSNTALNWSNWEGPAGVKTHLGYSYANPYPDEAAFSSGYKLDKDTSAESAVASDTNPGTSGDANVLVVTTTSNARDMRAGNSRNHDGDGQNVLYGDGHCEFQQNPFAGVQRDNIFVRRAGPEGFLPAKGPVAQSPYDAKDSVLLPTD